MRPKLEKKGLTHQVPDRIDVAAARILYIARNATSSYTLDLEILATLPCALEYFYHMRWGSPAVIRVVKIWYPGFDSRWNREKRTFRVGLLPFAVFTLSHSLRRNFSLIHFYTDSHPYKSKGSCTESHISYSVAPQALVNDS